MSAPRLITKPPSQDAMPIDRNDSSSNLPAAKV